MFCNESRGIISVGKTKVMAFRVKWPVRSNIEIDGQFRKEVNNLKQVCLHLFRYERDADRELAQL